MTRGSLFVAPLLACTLDPPPIIDLDLSASCNQAKIETRVTGVLGGIVDQVHAVVADADGSAGWALTETDADGVATFSLVRFPDPDVSVELGGVEDVADLQLVASAVSGEAWALERREGSMRAWRVEADRSPPLAGFSSTLHFFPVPDTDDWHRRLLFLGGVPHITAIQPASDDDATHVWVGRLAPGLGVETAWELRFETTCPPELEGPDLEACEANKSSISYPHIEWLAGPPDPRSPSATMVLRREEAYEGYPGEEDIVTVRIARLGSGMPTGVLRRIVVSWEGIKAPFSIAVDDFAAYVAHNSQWQTNVWRLDDSANTATILGLDPELAPSGGELVQLNGDIALGTIVDGHWMVTKLFSDAPSFSMVTMHESTSAPYIRATPAGPGHMLLHKTSGAPDLVQISCDESAGAPSAG